MAAIPGALRATLERFSPGSIKRRAENMGVLARILATPSASIISLQSISVPFRYPFHRPSRC